MMMKNVHPAAFASRPFCAVPNGSKRQPPVRQGRGVHCISGEAGHRYTKKEDMEWGRRQGPGNYCKVRPECREACENPFRLDSGWEGKTSDNIVEPDGMEKIDESRGGPGGCWITSALP